MNQFPKKYIFRHLHLHACYRNRTGFFLPKCPLTTVKSSFSVDEPQIVRGEAVDTFVVHAH